MKKANKINMLMLTGILSLGFMGNAVYAAAAETPDQQAFRMAVELFGNAPMLRKQIDLYNGNPMGTKMEYFMLALRENNKNKAMLIMKDFISTANRQQCIDQIKQLSLISINNIFVQPFSGTIMLPIEAIRLPSEQTVIRCDIFDRLFEMLLASLDTVSDDERMFIINQRLFLAIHEGSIDKVRLFLNQGASMNATLSTDVDPFINGFSVLMMAICTGRNDIAQLLIDRGADVDHEIRYNGYIHTALECAVTRNYPTLVDVLIQAGADVNCATSMVMLDEENHDPKTLLELAIIQLELATEDSCLGYELIMESLIQAGAKITRDTIICACKNNNHRNVAILIGALLSDQVLLQAQKDECFGIDGDIGNGHTGKQCGALEQLSGDTLNVILGYIGAQGCVALRRTCKALSQLEPDISALRMMLRQVAAKEFLQTIEEYFDKSIELDPGTTYLIEALTSFLREESNRPVSDIDRWEASVRKDKISALHEMEATDTTCLAKIQALEDLIYIVKAYYQESIRIIQGEELEVVQDEGTAENVNSSFQSNGARCLLFDESDDKNDRLDAATGETRRLKIEKDRAIIAEQNEAYQKSLMADQLRKQCETEQEQSDDRAGRAPVAADQMAAAVSAISDDDQEEDQEPELNAPQRRAWLAEVHERRLQNEQNK